MKLAGIDIGSRTIKYTLFDGKEIINYRIIDTGIDPLSKIKKLLNKEQYNRLIATGYGRYLAKNDLGCDVITEIKASALGANYLYPGSNIIIDVGGQDTKLIKAKDDRIEDFVMNDRCAAGTGRFLEIMATTLGFSIDRFGEEALKAHKKITINSMCTVFAESEVISLISNGENPQNIARGLHDAVINSLLSLIGGINLDSNIVFTGGVAKNKCIVKLLEERLNRKIHVPEEPQIVGSIGAALAAGNHTEKRK